MFSIPQLIHLFWNQVLRSTYNIWNNQLTSSKIAEFCFPMQCQTMTQNLTLHSHIYLHAFSNPKRQRQVLALDNDWLLCKSPLVVIGRRNFAFGACDYYSGKFKKRGLIFLRHWLLQFSTKSFIMIHNTVFSFERTNWDLNVNNAPLREGVSHTFDRRAHHKFTRRLEDGSNLPGSILGLKIHASPVTLRRCKR